MASLGNELSSALLNPSFLKRFQEKIDPIPIAGCWLWTGSLAGKYGALKLPRSRNHAYAHRVAYLLTGKDIPHGMYVCHRCDVPTCVNPAHLFCGSPSENVQDIIAKGRHRPPARKRRPVKAKPTAPLTGCDLDAALAMWRSGKRQADVAKHFGVSQQLVSLRFKQAAK